MLSHPPQCSDQRARVVRDGFLNLSEFDFQNRSTYLRALGKSRLLDCYSMIESQWRRWIYHAPKPSKPLRTSEM